MNHAPDERPLDPEAAARKAEARRRLRAALDGVELLPEMTRDDQRIRSSEQAARDEASRDAEFQANKPPHHGSPN